MEKISYCSPVDLHIAMTGSKFSMVDVICVVADIGPKGLTQFGEGSMREVALVDDRCVLYLFYFNMLLFFDMQMSD